VEEDAPEAGRQAEQPDREVEVLRGHYEWESFHDCPEREALFADEYMNADRDGPFSAFLLLLSAHRWLCAAEGYEHEQQPQHALKAREASADRLRVAMRASTPMIQTAAIALSRRGRCFATR
jgi:hypothetical protein